MRIWDEDDDDDNPSSLLLLTEEAGILQDTDPQRQRPEMTSDWDAASSVSAALLVLGAGGVVIVDAELALAVIEFAILTLMLLDLLLFRLGRLATRVFCKPWSVLCMSSTNSY